MLVEALKQMVENLDEAISDHEVGGPFFSDPRYRVFLLSREEFKQIEPVESNRRLAFVDGGNQEILGAPNFSIQFNRLYFGLFAGPSRIIGNSVPNRVEFLSSTHSDFKNEQIFYDTSLIPVDAEHRELLPEESDLSFNSFDRTVTVGTQRADIERVASIARKFAEWGYAFHIVEEELNAGDVLAIDGTLQTSFTNESKYATKLYKIAKSKNVIITGLSKTSSLFTTTGLSLLGAVRKLADDGNIRGTWCIPIAEVKTTDHNAFIFVVKLSPQADHVFRFEVLREQFQQLGFEGLNEILSQLVKNSQDISFPGYPYGLVDADCFARVTGSEAAGYQAILLSEISKRGLWPKFSRHIRAIDAHAILNTLMG